MKILAVRGKNLASLADEFAIELATPPLSEAGLFAITGPTGSGKSTILDALCLALFDRTPRLTDQGGVRIGLEEEDDKRRLASNDARIILTKGTAAGFAEVDFVGRDGRPYRARWAVRRARTGNLGEQELSLKSLDDERAIGSKKREVLDAIKERIGLDFEQFRRSALLAQGDFAAFLRAGPDERAQLLEKMTGTEIYQRISRSTYERAKREREALERAKAGLEDLEVLDDAARAELEGARAAIDGEVERARALLDELRAAQAFWRQRAELEDVIEKGRASLAVAEGELAAIAPLRAELAAVRSVQSLRPLFDGADAAGVEAERQGAAAEQSALEARRDAQRRDEARAQVGATAEELAKAEAYEREAAPAIAEAGALDAAIATATQLHETSKTAREQAQELTAAAAAELARIEREQGVATRAHDEAVARLTKGAPYRRLATEWSRFEKPLERYADAARERATIDVASLEGALV